MAKGKRVEKMGVPYVHYESSALWFIKEGTNCVGLVEVQFNVVAEIGGSRCEQV